MKEKPLFLGAKPTPAKFTEVAVELYFGTVVSCSATMTFNEPLVAMLFGLEPQKRINYEVKKLTNGEYFTDVR